MSLIPVGYNALIRQMHLKTIPHYRESFIALQGRGYIQKNHLIETHVYPKTYSPKNLNNPFEHLEFAFKYDGINLEILLSVFQKLNQNDIQAIIEQRPSGKFTRVLWFLYEFLTEEKLTISPPKRLKFVNILDPDQYFTARGEKSTRHQVNNNLIGNKNFCLIVRKTVNIQNHIDNQYDIKAQRITDSYDPKVISRASHYLYTKETLSSYKIEHEEPSRDRVHKFVHLLQKAPTIQYLTKKNLIDLQNAIVDPRFIDVDYRFNQNYVGENINPYFQKIHYISPKPESVESLMKGLLEILENLDNIASHPVIMAASIAFGFVFIHPFEDGNGRLHRFLIHYVLSKLKFTPKNIIFPISAVMLKNINKYDFVLEKFSKPLMDIVTDYKLSGEGILTVNQPTKMHYQFIDYTNIVEYLFLCIQETMDEHFEKEIEYLIKYDKTKVQIKSEIDMPDRFVDLFIQFVTQNNGELSKQKRKKYFEKLSDNEINTIQKIICTQLI